MRPLRSTNPGGGCYSGSDSTGLSNHPRLDSRRWLDSSPPPRPPHTPPRSLETSSPSLWWTGQQYACAEVVARPSPATRGRLGLGPERAEAAGAAEPRGASRSEWGPLKPRLRFLPGHKWGGGTPTPASSRFKPSVPHAAAKLCGLQHSSLQNPTSRLSVVPHIRSPPPKPSFLLHSPSCLSLTGAKASAGEAQVGVLRSRNPTAFGLQGYPTFWHLWAALEEELSWATPYIHCNMKSHTKKIS